MGDPALGPVAFPHRESAMELPAGSDPRLRAGLFEGYYIEGLCGGAVLPLQRTGRPRQDVHVPIAHQSALAGVLLAASAAQDALALKPVRTLLGSIFLDLYHHTAARIFRRWKFCVRKLVPLAVAGGLEPPTTGLTIRRSTN